MRISADYAHARKSAKAGKSKEKKIAVLQKRKDKVLGKGDIIGLCSNQSRGRLI